MTTSEINQIQSFLRLAHRGRSPGSSTGERAAYKLARQAEAITELMQDIDIDKQEGFARLLVMLSWPDNRDMLVGELPR
jgi:hypothetical protein